VPDPRARAWGVVAALFVVTFAAANPLAAYGVFLPVLAGEFGWSRGAISLALTINLFVGGVVGLVVGALADRRGPRELLVATSLLAGIGFALVSQVTALWQLYLVVGLMAGSGMSAFYVLSAATVARWFTDRRGLALAIVLTGYSVGVMTGGPIGAILINALGWRAAYLVLGLAVSAVGALAALGVTMPPAGPGVTRPPAGPDRSARAAHGGRGTGARAPDPGRVPPPGMALADALRDARLWLFGVSWMLSGCVLMMLSVHMAAFALDRGLPLEIAALALTAYGLGAVIGRIAFGAATDRFGVLPTMLVCAAIQIGSLAPLPVVTSVGPLLALLLLYGAGVIGGDGVFVKAVPDVFGVRALGGIMGVLAIGWRAGAAAGPAVAGFVHDATGSYAAAFALAPVVAVVGLGLFVLAVRRRR
jgi:MFS family permease